MTDHQPNYCPELWQRLFLNQSNQTFVAKPCCYFQETERPIWITDPTRIFEIYNEHDQIKEIRAANQQGHLGPGCRVCMHAEQAGMDSGRTSALKRLQDPTQARPIKHLDLNLGNLCNLACAICDPHSSTSWVPIYKVMQNRPWSYPIYDKHGRPVIDDPELFANLETIQLQGGEVFLQSAYVDFFRNLERSRDLGDIRVVIFTNGTVIPPDALWTLLGKCATVDLYFSIDDIEERFEYQRHGAKWDRVLANLEWFDTHAPDHFALGFHPTYSLLNIYYLNHLYQFMNDRFPDWSRRWGPYHVGTGPCIADTLPHHVREMVLDRHRGLQELSFLEGYIRSAKRNFGEFLDYIDRYDRATNSSYRSTHSEFHALITR